MLDVQTSPSSQRSISDFVAEVKRLTLEIQEFYCRDTIPWILGTSWGKDSSAVLQLVWSALLELPPQKRSKKIYVITTDTRVENPIVSMWVRQCLERTRLAAKEQALPIETHLLYPVVKNTFWVNLMGKGYPAPRHGFRWCTERLKIKPSNQFIRDTVRVSGEVILVLGTRKAESITRASSMEKHELGQVSDLLGSNSGLQTSKLYYSSSLQNALIYSPIQDWRTDEVWMYLMQWPNPWGVDNKDLFTMYRGATADNECPLVVDTSTPSCGDSRFGCWVCTMVSKDKSMEAMIQNDEEKEWMQPLLDIRNELDVADDRDKRDFRRIYGRVELFERNVNGQTSVEPIPGPYTKKWREYWLKRVLEAQTQVRKTAPSDMQEITLITPEELSEIRRIWLEEKHEFDDRLPQIYQEATGEPFIDPNRGAGNTLLGLDEWTILEELSDGDAMHLELMAKLLDIERQYHSKARRVGLYEALEKCFETSSRSKEEAIQNARDKRDLKTAIEQADIQKIKQLSWASLKFQAQDAAEEDAAPE
jgi:DNA sulfur modification protein DndC